MFIHSFEFLVGRKTGNSACDSVPKEGNILQIWDQGERRNCSAQKVCFVISLIVERDCDQFVIGIAAEQNIDEECRVWRVSE